MIDTSALKRELWTSWASLLRAYAGAHGLGAAQGAVVEVGLEEIVLRVGSRTLRFTHTAAEGVDGVALPFSLNEDGTATLGEETDEMDLLAERLAREMMRAG